MVICEAKLTGIKGVHIPWRFAIVFDDRQALKPFDSPNDILQMINCICKEYIIGGSSGGWNMFNVGDKIVYPMHGAGVIESIEEKEILGSKQNYYVMKMPVGDMKVMIPTLNVEGIGIREIIDSCDVDKVYEILQDQSVNVTNNWNKRYRENMTKIKSGNIYEVADVVRSLMIREREKGLSTGERKMLNSARQIMVSELVLAEGTDPGEIETAINDFLKI